MRLRTVFSLVRHEMVTSRRTASLFIAVLLGSILVVLSAVIGSTLDTRVHDGADVNYRGTDVVVRSQLDAPSADGGGGTAGDSQGRIEGRSAVTSENLEELGALEGISAVDGVARARAALWAGGKVTPTIIESLPDQRFVWQTLFEGRYPTSGTEVALSSETMKSTGVQIGDSVTMGTDESGNGEFTVVGMVDTQGALDYTGVDYAVVTPQLAQAFAGIDSFNEARIALANGADESAVMERINSAVPGIWPESTAALAQSTETIYGTGLSILSLTVNAFALIAALVALTVVGTVTWAGLSGRQQQLALLRLIGASKSQIYALVFVEAAGIALAGALLAIPLGIAAAYLVIPMLSHIQGVPQVAWSQIDVPADYLIVLPIVSVVGAVLAVVGTASAASRVAPADALRNSAGASQSRPRAVTARIAVVVLLAFLTLIAARVAGVTTMAIVGLLFFVALLASIPALCWAFAGIAEAIGGRRRPIAEISAAEVRAFPGHTAATGMAVLLAAAVMAVSWVTLSSVSAIAEERSIDDPGAELMVGSYSSAAPLDPVAQQALSEVRGVHSATPVNVGRVRIIGDAPSDSVTATQQSGQESGQDSKKETRLSQDLAFGEATEFSQNTHGRFPLDSSEPGVVYLPSSDQPPFRDGSTVRIEGPEGQRSLTVKYVPGLPLPGLLDPSIAESVGIQVDTSAQWLSIDTEAERSEVLKAVQTVATIGGDLPVNGTAVTDSKVDVMVQGARMIATVMLSIAAFIAILGAAVTLAASLRDRSRELAILRLLGIEGAQLRRMIGAETTVIGITSVLAGLLSGTILGIMTAFAVAQTLGVQPQIEIPSIALIVMGAVAVVTLRLVASAPVDRVSLVPPVAALRGANQGAAQ